MPWARLDDSFYDHPKTKQAGNEAVGLFARMLSYSTRFLTDGAVPEQALREMCGDGRRARALINRLIDVGYVNKPRGRPQGTGRIYRIHNYLQYQESAADIKARRAAEREKKRRQRMGLRPEGSPGGTGIPIEGVSPGDSPGVSGHPIPTPPTPQVLGGEAIPPEQPDQARAGPAALNGEAISNLTKAEQRHDVHVSLERPVDECRLCQRESEKQDAS